MTCMTEFWSGFLCGAGIMLSLAILFSAAFLDIWR
jgi:hypothetical protein